MKGLIINRDYQEINEKPFVFLYGRLENQKSFACMCEFDPYFFVLEKDEKILKKAIKKQEISIEKTNYTNFNQEKTLKLTFQNQKHLTETATLLKEFKIETYEQDLNPQTRFMIEKDLYDYIEIKGNSEQNERVDCLYINPEIKKTTGNFLPKTLSLDIETSNDGKNLFCIGLVCENQKKVFMITKQNIPGVTSCSDERDCLEKFQQEIIQINPDIIVGWNVIDFDFVFLKKLFDENKIPFNIGRNNKPLRLRIEKNFLKSSKMEIPGRIVLDGLNLIKDPFIKEAPSIKNIKFESYSLDEVASQILNKKKLISGKQRHQEIQDLYNGSINDQKKLAEYNLKDCELVLEIIEKTKIIELSLERANLTGMQLDKLTASIASFDSLYIRQARKKNLVSPSNSFGNKPEKIKGGFVIQPKSGIYENVLVLDFKSLYPSIIRTFNIDPSSQLHKKQKDCITSPNNAFFKNQEGILPEIIQKLYEAREKAKKENRELSSYAIKIIMNSFFGVLASPNSRYFNWDMGNAITNFGQEIIKLTAKQVEKQGLKVIYGDTDSIFIFTGKNQQQTEKLGRKIPEQINKFYQEYVEKNFSRKSFLELEFDKHYLSLLIPKTRLKENTERGAKKRYAGLIQQKNQQIVDIVGLEAIRGDWTEAAQEFQKQLLLKVFLKQEIIKFIRDYIKELQQGKLDKKLVYRKSIRKDLKEYTKTTPPHVKAARKLNKIESNLIEYYITKNGPEPLQKITSQIDYEHYVEKQIKPIAKTILETLEIDPDRVFSETRQETLF